MLGAIAYYSPTKIVRSPASTNAITLSDRLLENFTVAIEIRTILIEGTQAAVEWDWSETAKGTDQKTSHAQDAILIDFETGGIRRWREYIDTKTK